MFDLHIHSKQFMSKLGIALLFAKDKIPVTVLLDVLVAMYIHLLLCPDNINAMMSTVSRRFFAAEGSRDLHPTKIVRSWKKLTVRKVNLER